MPNTHQDHQEPEGTVYQSKDGLVEVQIKTSTARRWPQHNYPIVCLVLKAARATRVQTAEDGRIDVLLNNEEIGAFFEALKRCDPNFDVTMKSPPKNKCRLRKRKWDDLNRRRHGQQ